MSDLARWLVAGRVIYTVGTMAKDVMNYRNQIIADMMTEAGETPMVHLLLDYRNVNDSTDEALRLKYYVDAQHDEGNQALIKHPLLGWSISIDPPHVIVRLAATIISQQNNYRWHYTQTTQSALDFLVSRDPSLPDMTDLKKEVD